MSPYDASRHGPRRLVGPGFHSAVHAMVRRIPRGQVATYGDVAAALGSARIARQVGFALAALPVETDVPWWRVVAANGRLARAGELARRQAALLRGEGVSVRRGQVAELAMHRSDLRDSS